MTAAVHAVECDALWGPSLTEIRHRLAGAFSADTAYPGTKNTVPSAGHCAAVAWLVYQLLGGHLVSAHVRGVSHWFNRLGSWDVDLTGDQYERPPICLAPAGALWPGTYERGVKDLQIETIARARLLALRAGLMIET